MAAICAPSIEIALISSECSIAAGATRMTPPQPLLLFSGAAIKSVTLRFGRSASADRQVFPGALRLYSSGYCRSRLPFREPTGCGGCAPRRCVESQSA